MKKFKKLFVIVLVVGILGATGVAYAATSQTPAEIVSGLTGKTVEEVYQERTDGKTFGAIADEADKLDEFQTLVLEQKKAVLDERVAAGTLTQEEADEIYNTIVNNQLICDGTGTGNSGNGIGCGTGGSGIGCGQGAGRGAGMRNGSGMGFGRGINQ